MNATKLLTALMAMLVVSAGAGAVSAASLDAETTTVDASYDDGTVTLTVKNNTTGVENVSVETENFSGTTDANGTVMFDTNATELDVEFSKNGTTFERSYVIDNETISEADDEEAEESALDATATYDNGTVTVDVTENDTAAENVTVTANGVEKGMTDANGTLTFNTSASETLELVFEKGEMELEQTYSIEDGSLVMVEDEDEEDEKELSANENASDRAHNVLAVIQQFLTDGSQGNLGQMIQDALGDDRGNSENAKENGNGNAAGANGNADNADNKGNGNADKADKANNGKQNDKADKKGNNGNGHADDEDDEDDEEEEEDETGSDE